MLHHEGPLLWGYTLDGQGGGAEIGLRELLEQKEIQAIHWLHFDRLHPQTEELIRYHLDIDPLIVEALLAEETRPRLSEFENGHLIILRGVNLNDPSLPEDMVALRVWVEKKRIITARARPVKATKDLREKLLHHKGPKNVSEFLTMLVSQISEHIDPVISDLNDDMDLIEEQVLENSRSVTHEDVVLSRKRAMTLRRYLAPQKEVFFKLMEMEENWIEAIHHQRIREQYYHLVRCVEDLDSMRERAQVVQDELNTHQTEQLTRNTYRLSVMASIFLPLSFLTGLFGMNLNGIPGSSSPASFPTVCLIMVILAAIQLRLYRTRRIV